MMASTDSAKTTSDRENAEISNAILESYIIAASDKSNTIQSTAQNVGRSNWLKKPLKTMLGSGSTPKKIKKSSRLLALPRELRDQIFGYLIPNKGIQFRPEWRKYRPELRTCLWRTNMTDEPWGYEKFLYLPSVPKRLRLDLTYLLINHQIHEEVLELYFRHSKFELHAELRNIEDDPTRFIYSPLLPSLPFLKYITHCHLWVKWQRIITTNDQYDELGAASGLLQTIDKLLERLQVIETIQVSVSFSWKRTGKYVALSVEDRCDLMEIFSGHAEARWLERLQVRSPRYKAQEYDSGVGYKIYSRRKGHKEKSGEMDIYVSITLEDSMNENKPGLSADEESHERLPQPLLPRGRWIDMTNLAHLRRLGWPGWRGSSTHNTAH